MRPGERGQALLVLVLTLSIATVLLVYGSTTEATRLVRADARTRAVLQEATQALIGRAVADSNRPGSLPCPDNDDDGSADLFAGSTCRSYLGRLPWRTLGIGDLRDAAGERLWYALSPPFRDHPYAPALNSDTRGTLAVYSIGKARAVTNQAIAIVFAPGGALGGQRRDASVTFCDATAKNAQRSRCPSNYLDAHAEANNALATGPFIAAPAREVMNDKLATIVAADLMPLVERRVALELRNALLAYKAASACACYPWADSGNDGRSDAGAHQGRIPAVDALPEPWRAGALPAYFTTNDWKRVFYYAVGREALAEGGKACTTCTQPNLSLDSQPGFDVVLITPGYVDAKAPRSSWSDYVDDPDNRDNDERFVTPISPRSARDGIYAIAGKNAGCAVHARVLIDHAPCRAPANAIRPVCESARSALKACTCTGAASALVNTPCADTLTPQQCDNAMTQLRECL